MGTRSMKVNVLAARNRLSQLIKAAQAGEDVVIANRGRPVARLSAIVPEELEEAPIGSSARILGWLDQHPLPTNTRSVSELESAIQAERDAWD